MDRSVLEILDNVSPNFEIVMRCDEMKSAGDGLTNSFRFSDLCVGSTSSENYKLFWFHYLERSREVISTHMMGARKDLFCVFVSSSIGIIICEDRKGLLFQLLALDSIELAMEDKDVLVAGVVTIKPANGLRVRLRPVNELESSS